MEIKENLIKQQADMSMYPVFDEGHTTLLWLFPENREQPIELDFDGGTTAYEDVTVAWPVRVTNPCTRAAAINAAEMAAYNLKDGMDVASFTAGLARKFRDDPEDEEVIEHDAFIHDVKAELTRIGIK